MFKCLAAWLHAWCTMRISYQLMDPTIQKFTESYCRSIQLPRLTLKTLQIPFIPSPKFTYKEFCLPITGMKMFIHHRKLSGIFSKGRYIPLFIFLFLKPKNASYTNPRYLFFPALPGLKGRNIAVRDSYFWLDSINTTPHSGNLQENSQTANANFVLLPFIIPLK